MYYSTGITLLTYTSPLSLHVSPLANLCQPNYCMIKPVTTSSAGHSDDAVSQSHNLFKAVLPGGNHMGLSYMLLKTPTKKSQTLFNKPKSQRQCPKTLYFHCQPQCLFKVLLVQHSKMSLYKTLGS